MTEMSGLPKVFTMFSARRIHSHYMLRCIAHYMLRC